MYVIMYIYCVGVCVCVHQQWRRDLVDKLTLLGVYLEPKGGNNRKQG